MGFYLNKEIAFTICHHIGNMGVFVKLAFVVLVACTLLPAASSMELMFTEDQIFGICTHTCETGAISARAIASPAVQTAMRTWGCRSLSACRRHRHGFIHFTRLSPDCDYCYCTCN